MRFSFLFSIILLLLPIFLIAQINNQPIKTGNFTGKLKDLILQFEKTNQIRIFYPPEFQGDTVINVSYENLTPNQIFNPVLAPLGYILVQFNSEHYVIVSRQQKQFVQVTDINMNYDSARNNKIRFNGYIRDANSGERIPGAAVRFNDNNAGTTTNSNGFYSLEILPGIYSVEYSFLGYQPENKMLNLNSNRTVNIELFEKTMQLETVTIFDQSIGQNVETSQVGKNSLNLKMLKSLPPFLGEIDVLKTILQLPGVSTVGEGAAGFNVRGGNVDQNLILLDDAPIYNPNHLFGFFSAFQGETIKNASLYKGGIPAQFGGRLSSVLDITTREGSQDRWGFSGGIGLLSARAILEGPVVKGRSSILLSGRTSYSDWLLRSIRNDNLDEAGAAFNDFSLKYNHQLNKNNNLVLSGYTSNDRFQFESDTTYRWNNQALTVKWNSILNDRLLGSFGLIYSKYGFEVDGEAPGQVFGLSSGVVNRIFKADFTHAASENLKIDFGGIVHNYLFKPGELEPGKNSNFNPVNLEQDQALESAVYAGMELGIGQKINLMAGARFSMYQVFGPGETLRFAENQPLNSSSVTDTLSFSSGELITRYQGIEPRFSMRYGLNSSSSIKIGYNRMRQYVHLISNTTAVTPIDVWQTSNPYIRPQVADQFSIGYFRNFRENTIETSLELYYKSISDLVDYKEGADLVLKPNLETELVQGEGMAYGAELLVRKNFGKLTGWFGYTYSRSLRKFDSDNTEEIINSGEFFPSNFDKPHDLSIASSYQFSQRISFSFNFTYSTGRPVSLPTAKYFQDGLLVVKYSERNQFRIPDYHRLDVSLTIEGNHRKKTKWHGSYNFSVYNLYGRDNPYSIFVKPNGFNPQAYQLSVIAVPIPTFTYNFRF